MSLRTLKTQALDEDHNIKNRKTCISKEDVTLGYSKSESNGEKDSHVTSEYGSAKVLCFCQNQKNWSGKSSLEKKKLKDTKVDESESSR